MQVPAIDTTFCVPMAMSDSGNFVAFDNYEYPKSILRWDRSAGSVQTLDVEQGYATPLAMSGDGNCIVGWAEISDGHGDWFYRGPAKWIGSDGPFLMPTPQAGDDVYFYPNATNHDGSVTVGERWQENVGWNGVALRWGSSGNPVELGMLPGTTRSIAYSVSGDGNVVVGDCGVAGLTTKAFVWTPQSGMRDLAEVLTEKGIDFSGWALRTALCVSRDGTTIAGWGEHDGGIGYFVVRVGNIIRKVDTLVQFNGLRHETDKYKPEVVEAQVVRRGRPFEIDVELFDPFEVTAQSFKMQAVHRFDLAPGSDPDSEPVPTTIEIPLFTETPGPTQWGCRVLNERLGPIDPNDAGTQPVKTVSLAVYTPSNAPVGEYVFSIVAGPVGQQETYRLGCEMALLFNPLSGGDPAMPERVSREEYLHLKDGLIFTDQAPYPWAYSQFSRDVFRVTMKLLGNASSETRGSSTMTARYLSAYGNSSSSARGLLVGDWEKELGDISPSEVHPTTWRGSELIFRKYVESGSVSFGQCWVFAGTLTSACRTLGIPARPVTNFLSGHEEPPYDLKIPRCWVKYYDKKANQYRWKLSGVWNFHVWVEAWLNGGWSAIDSTPQETSDGLYQLGPAPVVAVKARSVNTPFDVPFVISEVDADVWDELGDRVHGPKIPRPPNAPCVMPANAQLNTTFVGQGVVTKLKGSNMIESITVAYKTPEFAAPAPLAQPPASRLVVPSKINLGENFAGEVVLTNSAITNEDFVVRRVLAATTYTGRPVAIVSEPVDATVTLLPGGATSVPLSCPWSTFKSYYPDAGYIEVSGFVTRVSTGETWSLASSTPVFDLAVTISSPALANIPVGTVFDATVACTNPLSHPIQNCVFTISGGTNTPMDGTRERDEVSLGTINPGESRSVTRTFKAIAEGYSSVSAWFSADGLRTSGNAISVNVNRCAGDLTEDTIVDDEDFLRFVIAYNLLDCNSRQMDVRCLGDMNGDGMVDDADFQMFVVAYNQLVCS